MPETIIVNRMVVGGIMVAEGLTKAWGQTWLVVRTIACAFQALRPALLDSLVSRWLHICAAMNLFTGG